MLSSREALGARDKGGHFRLDRFLTAVYHLSTGKDMRRRWEAQAKHQEDVSQRRGTPVQK